MLGWISNIIFIGLVLSVIYAVLSYTVRRKQLLLGYLAQHS